MWLFLLGEKIHKNIGQTFHMGVRNYNDKAYTSPQLFGQFFNFRIFIKLFIYDVKKPSKF